MLLITDYDAVFKKCLTQKTTFQKQHHVREGGVRNFSFSLINKSKRAASGTVSSIFLWLWILLLVLLFPSVSEGIIRNQRVILSDEHIPKNACDLNRDPACPDDLPDEHIRVSSTATSPIRPKRALKNWRDELHRRALTFGQSETEVRQVSFYMERLKELSEAKHPDPIKLTTTTSGTPIVPGNGLSDEMTQELAKWNSRRLSDVFGWKTSKKIQQKDDENPEENGRFYEGDIVLTPDQAKELYEQAIGGKKRTKRKFIGSKVRRWDPKKPIYFSFDGSHTLREQRVIELALEHWHNITCLNFERRSGEELKGNRIIFTEVDGCASNVGKHPLGEPQFVSLAPECIRLGVIAHEVAHALGFWHEQSRPDRDFYVQVQWENIDKDSKGQFTKEQPVDVDNGGVAYDYGSIMHYRSKAFAKYDDLFTLSTFVGDYQRTIGQRDQLSFNDIRLMNTIYCKDTCPRKLACQRGGYTDPRRCDRCRCPDGFTGVLCDQVMPGYGADCGGRIELNSSWIRISSPNYPSEFKEGQECSWLLQAPLGQQVQFNFVGEFEMYCKVRHSLCMDYVEIRNSSDFANTGMRYCCYGTPKSTIVSSTRDMGDDTETEVCNTQPCRGLCSRKRSEESECTGIFSLLSNIRCKVDKTKLEECEEICCAGFALDNDGFCSKTGR